MLDAVKCVKAIKLAYWSGVPCSLFTLAHTYTCRNKEKQLFGKKVNLRKKGLSLRRRTKYGDFRRRLRKTTCNLNRIYLQRCLFASIFVEMGLQSSIYLIYRGLQSAERLFPRRGWYERRCAIETGIYLLYTLDFDLVVCQL